MWNLLQALVLQDTERVLSLGHNFEKLPYWCQNSGFRVQGLLGSRVPIALSSLLSGVTSLGIVPNV